MSSNNKQKKRSLRTVDSNNRRNRRDNRIINSEELNKIVGEDELLERDILKSALNSELREFIEENKEKAKNLAISVVNRKINDKKETSKITKFHMGDIQVTTLQPHSSKGSRLANSSYRNQIDFRTVRTLLEEFKEIRPSLKRRSNNSKEERLKKRRIISKFGQTPLDTGSTAVQIALKTARIEELKKHFLTAKKDKHSKRGFIKLIQDRKSLLKYLKEKRPEEYRRVISELNLRK